MSDFLKAIDYYNSDALEQRIGMSDSRVKTTYAVKGDTVGCRIKIKKLKPIFDTVITTLDIYEDDVVQNGIVIIPAGAVKQYQTVLAVGEFVKNINVGDLVMINFSRFIKRKYKENSIKNDEQAMIDEPILDVPKIYIDGKLCCKITDRDIDGIILETEEVELNEQSGGNTNSLLDA